LVGGGGVRQEDLARSSRSCGSKQDRLFCEGKLRRLPRIV